MILWYVTTNVTMNNWGYTIKRLMAERGMTHEELARATGLTRPNITQIVNGRNKSPTEKHLKVFSKAFNMTVEQLVAEIYGTPSGRKYPPLSEKQKLGNLIKIPLYTEYPYHAGDGVVEPFDYIYRRQSEPEEENIEGYVVRGTCLKPLINDGDIIIIDRERAIENGDIVACTINGELHVARLKRYDNELWLENNESKYKIQECINAAVVIEVRKRLK